MQCFAIFPAHCFFFSLPLLGCLPSSCSPSMRPCAAAAGCPCVAKYTAAHTYPHTNLHTHTHTHTHTHNTQNTHKHTHANTQAFEGQSQFETQARKHSKDQKKKSKCDTNKKARTRQTPVAKRLQSGCKARSMYSTFSVCNVATVGERETERARERERARA